MEETPVDDLSPLVELDELNLVYADGSEISEKDVLYVREQNPDCFILFKTDALKNWWRDIPSPWKRYFEANYKINATPTKEQVHQLFYLEELEVKEDRDIATLVPVTAMTNLKKIVFVNLNAGNLSPLSDLEDLEELTCKGMPVNDLSPLSNLKNLGFLDLENTSVNALDALATVPRLRHINASGTQIKDLKALSGQRYLESVEINNTPVKSVKHISGLPSLTSLSCYNTRISSKNIEKFKEENPNCKVVYY
jgi:Leucine-rich repeat (LRR) protein